MYSRMARRSVLGVLHVVIHVVYSVDCFQDDFFLVARILFGNDAGTVVCRCLGRRRVMFFL